MASSNAAQIFARVSPRLSAVLSNLEEADLSHPTPCEGLDVRDVGTHLTGFLMLTIHSARKRPFDYPPSHTPGDQELLKELPSLLAQAVDAWQEKNATRYYEYSYIYKMKI